LKCPNSQFNNPDGAHFGNECGGQLEMACPNCGKANPPNSKFCNGCSRKLTNLKKSLFPLKIQEVAWLTEKEEKNGRTWQVSKNF